MEEAGVKLIAQNINVYIGDLKDATSATNSFVDSTEKGGGRVSASGQVMIGALRKVGSVAVEAFGQALKATAAFIGDSIGLAGDFEAGMLNFQAVAGKDVDTKGLEQFRDLFLQIGKELPVSTADVQKAATEMIKGGIDPAIVAAGGLRQNIQFAAAAMEGDLVAAAEISGKILGGWASSSATATEKADFLTHATNLLTKAANASAVDVKGLSLGIFNAQGIAKTAGVSFDDLTTTLAALAPRFASTSEAGNSLKNMIARLQPTTSPAASAMEGLGLYSEETGSAFYDLQGNFVGFETAAQLLKDSLVGLTKEQQAFALQTIFGNDAMGSAAALADMGSAGYANMADAMAKANGVAENAALKQQGFNTAMDNAKGSVEALQITVGSHLLPVLTDLINNVVAPGINAFTDLADALFGNEEAFSRLSPTMQSVASMIGIMIEDVQNIIDAFDDAGSMSSEFGESIGKLAGDLGLPGELIQDIVFATQDLVKWFNKAGGESDALGKATDDLSGIWNKALVVVGNVADGYMAIAQAVLPVVAGFIDEHGTEISAFFQESWDTIAEIVNLALDVYNSIVPPVLNAIAGFISDHASEIQKVLSGVWTVISSLITGTLDTIKGIFKVALAVINGDWEGAWAGIGDIANAQITAIGGAITGFLNMIAGLFDTSMAEIGQTWQHNWDALVDIATQTDWGAVGASVVSGILQGLRDNWDSLTGWVSDRIGGLVDAALDAIGAGSPAVEWMPVGAFAVQGIMVGFQNMMPRLTTLVAELGDDLVSQAADIASQVQDAIGDAFGATASINRQKISNLEKFADVADRLKGGVQFQLQDAEKVAQGISDPQQAAAWFKQRSNQIFELADITSKLERDLTDQQRRGLEDNLRKYEQDIALLKGADADDEQANAQRAHIMTRMAEAQAKLDNDLTDSARQMLIDKYQLVNAAQNAETAQAKNTQSQGSATQDLIDQIQALLANKDMPGLLEDPIVRALHGYLEQLRNASHRAFGGPVKRDTPYWVGEDGPELFWPQMNGSIMPAASSQQMAAQASTTNYNTTYNNTMPMYTNNSPGALQQSWAIMQASMA